MCCAHMANQAHSKNRTARTYTANEPELEAPNIEAEKKLDSKVKLRVKLNIQRKQ